MTVSASSSPCEDGSPRWNARQETWRGIRIPRSFLVIAAFSLWLPIGAIAQEKTEECGTSRAADSLAWNRIFAEQRTVQLETPPEHPVIRIADLDVGEHGKIFVLDEADYDLKAFAPDGSFLGVFGERGSEAGRFIHPVSVAVTGDSTIGVVDDGRMRLIVYSVSGTLLRETPLPIRPVGKVIWLANGFAVGGLGPVVPSRPLPDTRSVHLLAANGSIKTSVVDMPDFFRERPAVARNRVPLIAPALHPGHTGEILTTWRVADHLYRVDTDGTVTDTVGLPETEHFRGPRIALKNVPSRAHSRILTLGSPIIRLISAKEVVLVGYFAAFQDNGRIRYHIFDGDLAHIASDVSGPSVFTGRDSLVVAARAVPRSGAGEMPTKIEIVTYRVCPK